MSCNPPSPKYGLGKEPPPPPPPSKRIPRSPGADCPLPDYPQIFIPENAVEAYDNAVRSAKVHAEIIIKEARDKAQGIIEAAQQTEQRAVANGEKWYSYHRERAEKEAQQMKDKIIQQFLDDNPEYKRVTKPTLWQRFKNFMDRLF